MTCTYFLQQIVKANQNSLTHKLFQKRLSHDANMRFSGLF